MLILSKSILHILQMSIRESSAMPEGRDNEKLSRPSDRQPRARIGPLAHDFAFETHELGGPPAAFRRDLPGFLDQALLLDEAAEILLMELEAGEGLDRALQPQEREAFRHQLEDDRAIFDLGPQPCDRGREDAAMIMHHRLACDGIGDSPALPALGYQLRLVKQLVTLQDQLLVPVPVGKGKGRFDALLALAPLIGIGGGPKREAPLDRGHDLGRPAAPILPRKIAIPIAPARILRTHRPRLPG